ncbi:D-arabinitol dehydrogenase (NADP+) [Rhodococcus sp. 27YEA15]|uniref:zinc-dependent alcohol dehydrogenase family protein n=1 Tax=Rhodococcus sp. 27YEA15 TaxID=3156259 RepID=UPI003C7B24BD
MNNTMTAVVYDEPGTFEIREIPVPTPGPGEVLVKVLAAGVCGTDLHLHAGEFGPTYPLIPGHEIAGEIAAIGPDVTDPAVGTRVVVDNTASCGRCEECRRARPAFCTSLVAQGVNAPGGFSEYVITSANRCFVADDLDPEVAVLTEPVACVVHGLDVLDLQPGAHVLLFGAGPTGLLLTELLRNCGAGSLTVAAPTQSKLDLASARGADNVVQIDRGDMSAALDTLRAIRPQGFDVVIDATGSVNVLAETVDLTRTGGTVFVYGMAAEAAKWPISPYEIFRRELTVKGSFAQQFSFDRAISALRSGRVSADGLVTHRFPLHRYAEALDAVRDSNCVKAMIVPGL